MKRVFRITLIALILSPVITAFAQEKETVPRLRDALKAAAAFEPGGDSRPLVEAEQIVFQLSPDSEVRPAVEESLIEALAGPGSVEFKRFLCRQLRVIGTARCVPALEPLLADAELSHMARYALGRLEAPEASAALLRALGKTNGPVQAGIINTLADRRYAPAGPELIRLMASPDAVVAKTAADGLGRLGGAEAAEALGKARPGASGEMAVAIDNALLNAAELFVAEGDADSAAKIYEAFANATSPALRQAGLRGLVMARGDRAAGLLVEAMQSNEPSERRFAISLIELVPGEKATKAFVDALGFQASEEKVLMLRALGARGDAVAAPAVSALTKDDAPAVRIAALEALGKLGDPSVAGALIEAAASAGGEEKGVARASLKKLGPEVDARLVKLLDVDDAELQAEAIRALADRGATASVGRLLEAAEDEEPSVRAEAIRALGSLAGKSQIDALVRLTVDAKSPEDRSAMVESTARVFRRIDDSRVSAAPVLAAWQRAKAEDRPVLLALLGKAGSAEALREVRAALAAPDPALQDAAVAALADWPDQTACEDLLKLIGGNASPAHKSLALKGYMRLAAMADDPAAMYLQALKRVESTGDKKAVLEELGLSSEAAEALDVTLGYLDDPELRDNAGVAVLRIAYRLRQKDESRARAALKTVLAKVEHPDVRVRAQEVLNDLDKYEDHILTWVGAGPFEIKGKDGATVYATAFPPETNPDAADWKPITKGIGSWEINLEATYGGMDCCAAYLRTQVISPVDQDVRLEMGSDDAIKAWLNGRLVHDKWKESGADPRQVIVPVKLRKGRNDLMLKVVDQAGGWVGACRIRKPDGTKIEGLEIKPE